MIRRRLPTFGPIAAFLLASCGTREDVELRAYLTAIDSVSVEVAKAIALNRPGGANVCFASDFFLLEGVLLPQQLQQALHERGWELYDSDLPPDTGTFLVFVSQPQFEGDLRLIAAGYHTVERYKDEIAAWGDYWDYRLRCQGDSCWSTEVSGGNHYDTEPISVEEFLARGRGKCTGTVPGSG